MKLEYILLIVLSVLVILFISHVLFLNNSYRPYYENSIFRKEYPYEGFGSFSSIMSTPVSSPPVKNVATTIQPATESSLLRGSDYNAPENPIDLFSQLKSSSECLDSSSGLYNSTGGLCLSGDAMKALKTRGGNQSLPIM